MKIFHSLAKFIKKITFGLIDFTKFSLDNLIIKILKAVSFGYLKFDGQKINLSILDYIIYTVIPGGQIFLRFFKLNGSLDKPYMFFPLFLLPPFSWIVLYLAKLGLFKRGTGGNPIDFYIIIPIIVKFISLLLFNKMPVLIGLIVKVALITVSLVVMNLLHFKKRDDCKSDNTRSFTVLLKSIIDSFIIYGGGMAAQILINFIPFIGEIYEVIELIPIGGIDKIVEIIIWAIGGGFTYFLNNMIYNTEKNVCKDSPSFIRNIIGLVAIVFTVFKEGENKLF